MPSVFAWLEREPFFILFGVMALGMWLGRRKIGNVSLGSVVCILLVGLVSSAWAYAWGGVSLQLPVVLQTVFFNLFIFAIGVKVGPQFFAGLERGGWSLVAVGASVSLLAAALAYGCGWLFQWPRGTVAGVLAGSNTSSVAFGSAISAGQRAPAPVTAAMSAAFALCYTLGQMLFVVVMKLIPRLGRFDAADAAADFSAATGADRAAPLPGTFQAGEVEDTAIAIRSYRAGERIVGKTVGGICARAPRISVELVRRGGAWLTPEDGLELLPDDQLVVAAPVPAQVLVRELLGPEIPDLEARSLTPMHTVDVVVNEGACIGRSLPELRPLVGPGLYLNALFRAGASLPVGPETTLKLGDVVRVTGTEPHIERLSRTVGQVIRSTHRSDVLTLAVGLLVGAALGAIPIPLFGIEIRFGSTAVLLTGILFAWLKTRHPAFGGPISEGGRRLMEEMGLCVFAAVLAVNAGPAVYQVLAEGPVGSLVVGCLLVGSVPAIVTWWLGRHVLRLNLALLMGALAGARQNTPSMQVAEELTRSSVPGIGYPVPLAVSVLTLSILAYVLALFA